MPKLRNYPAAIAVAVLTSIAALTATACQVKPRLHAGNLHPKGHFVSQRTTKRILRRSYPAVHGTGIKVFAGDLYKPRAKWCPTSHNCFTTLSWRSYGGQRAVAAGTVKSCPPPALESPCLSGPAEVTLSSPINLGGKTRFKTLSLKTANGAVNFEVTTERPWSEYVGSSEQLKLTK